MLIFVIIAFQKTGTCPQLAEADELGLCAFLCNDDHECPETKKCCVTSCGGTSCMNTLEAFLPPLSNLTNSKVKQTTNNSFFILSLFVFLNLN